MTRDKCACESLSFVELCQIMLSVLPRLFACAQRNVPLCSPQQLRRDIIIYFNQMLQEGVTRHRVELSSGPRWRPANMHLRPRLVARHPFVSACLCARGARNKGSWTPQVLMPQMCARDLRSVMVSCISTSLLLQICVIHTRTHGSLACMSLLQLNALPSSGYFK